MTKAPRPASPQLQRQSTTTRDEHVELILVSHRGPVRFDPFPTRTGGGLVTALRDLVRHVGHTQWVCAALTDHERALAADRLPIAIDVTSRVPIDARLDTSLDVDLGQARDATCDVRFVATDPDQHHGFYAVIANPMLWFIQHGLWDHTRTPMLRAHEHAAWHNGYLAVNDAFADEVASATADTSAAAIIMIHDYHFYTLPTALRARGVNQVIHFFVHIPWPAADAWRTLPPEIRDAIVIGLLHCDVVGFHTERYARNFLATCADLLRLEVNWSDHSVRFEGRSIAVRFYPISVDASSLREIADGNAAEHHQRLLSTDRPRHLILRVDRADPSKNILRGFHAFERLCARHSNIHGHVVFLALIQPTREDVLEYRLYRKEIEALARDINERIGHPGWQPIDLRFVEDMALTVAAYREFDVLMVNALADGMNLVAKEAMLINERHGIVALSELAGAHEELGAIAVTLFPFDIEQQAEALWQALTMPPDERRRRSLAGKEIVETNNVAKWLGHQLDDLASVARLTP